MLWNKGIKIYVSLYFITYPNIASPSTKYPDTLNLVIFGILPTCSHIYI